jgi:hypothetical protein
MREIYEILEDLLVELIDTVDTEGCVIIDSGSPEVIDMIENELSEKEAYFYKINKIAETYETDAKELANEKGWQILGYQNNVGIRICK